MIPQGGIDRNIQAAKLRAGSNPNVLAQEYKKTQSIETLLAMQSLKEELGKREQEIAAQMQGPEGSIMEQTEAQLMALVNPQSDSTNDVLGQMAPVMDRRGKEEAKAQMMPSGPKPPPPIQGKAPAPPNGAPQGIAGLNPRMGMAEGGIVPPADRYAEGGFTKLPPQDPTPDSLKWLMTEAPETTGYTAEQLTNANNVFRDSNGRMQMGRPQGILKNHIEGLDGPDTTDYSALIPSQEEQDARATDFWGSSPSLMSINALYRGVAPEGHYTRYLNDIEQNTARGILNGTVEYTPDTRLDNPLYDPYTGLYRNAPEPYVPGTPTFGPQPVPVDQGNNQVDGFTAPIDSNNQNNNQAPVVELASSNNQNDNQDDNQDPVVESLSSNNQALPYGADFSNQSEIEIIDSALEAGATPEQIIANAHMWGWKGGLTAKGLSYLEDKTGYSPDGMAEGGMVGYADGGEVEGKMSNEAVLAVAKLVEGGMSKKDAEAILKKIENERIQRKRKPKANLANKLGQGARAFMDSNPEDLLPLVREGKAIVGGASAAKDAVMDYGPSFSEVGEALAAGYRGESSPQLTGMFEKRPPPPTEPQMGGAPMRDLANQGGVKDPRSYMSTSINKPIGMRNQGNPPPQAQPQAQPEGLAALAAGVAPAPQRPMTQAEQLAANLMSRNPDDMAQASEKRYQTREGSLGIGALAERLAANSRATSAYNDTISDPRKSAWERFSAGARNASDAGGGTALGNYSKGSASERARQERQQQAFFETDAANIGKETELASGRLDALTSAYGSGQTRGDASQLAGLSAENERLATEAKQKTNAVLAEANMIEREGLDFQKTQASIMAMRGLLGDMLKDSQKMFEESGDASRELISDRRKSVPGAAEEYQGLYAKYLARMGLDENMRGLKAQINKMSGVGGIKKEFELKNVK